MIKTLAVAATAAVFSLTVGGNAATGVSTLALQNASAHCIAFQSPGKLTAGTPFRVRLLWGLEFRLSPTQDINVGPMGWEISLGPIDDAMQDYLWVVSPPLQTAPHRVIGPGYGLTARQSAQIERRLHFVPTRTDYDAARVAIDLPSAEETLQRLHKRGRGRLSLTITDHHIREVTLPDGRPADAFAWVAFRGEACVPKG